MYANDSFLFETLAISVFYSNVGVTLQKARKRVEHHLTRIGFGKGRRQIISREVTPGKYSITI